MAVTQSAAPLLERRFAWRGREIAWTSIGSGPPVVMRHSTPWSSWLWAPYARALADWCPRRGPIVARTRAPAAH